MKAPKKSAKFKPKKSQKAKAKPSAKAKKSASKLVSREALLKDVWPMERDFFERPDRLRYVRKLIKEEGCVFCNAEKKDLSFDSLCMAKTKYTMVIMNKFPYNTGHLLVLPRRHIGEIWQLNPDEIKDIAMWIQASMKILNKEYNCSGMNVGLNHGIVAGAGIPEHLHWHVIPRWAGDTNFFPLIAQTKALPETLEQSYGRLEAAFLKEMKSWSTTP